MAVRCFFVLSSISSRLAEPMAIRADINVPDDVNDQFVSNIPMAGNIDAWNIMAPVILPSARVSFSRDIQMTLLNFSGSSVAIGVKIIARTNAGMCIRFDM